MDYHVVVEKSLYHKRDWTQFFGGLKVLCASPNFKSLKNGTPFLYVSSELFVNYRWERLLTLKGEGHLLIYGDGLGTLSVSRDALICDIATKYHIDGLTFGGLSLLTHITKNRMDLLGIEAAIAEKRWSHPQAAIFLDRDGVLIEDNHYTIDYGQITFREDVLSALTQVKKSLSPTPYFFVVSNQSGIGRGYFSSQQVQTLHQQLGQDLAQKGITVKEWAFCPHHNTHGHGDFLKDSFSRKPYPGMVLGLCEKYPINLDQSLMIGDQVTDDLLLPQLNTIHIQGSKDLSNATAPVFNDAQEMAPAIVDCLSCIKK